MAILRATVVLRSKSPDRRDDFRNVWHFVANDTLTATRSTIATGLSTHYYNGVASYIGQSVERTTGGCRVEIAEVIPGQPGSPDDLVTSLLGTFPFTLGAAGTGASLPLEVAVVHSFRGDVAGLLEEEGQIRPRSRKRGRIYLGPLMESARNVGSDGFPLASSVFTNQMLNGYAAARNAWSAGAGSPQHVIYSRASASVAPVVYSHVDDALDTVRSRGRDATLRIGVSY